MAYSVGGVMRTLTVTWFKDARPAAPVSPLAKQGNGGRRRQ